jgi:hypothetical protein
MSQKNLERVNKDGKKMCNFKSSPKEIEHSCENKVISIFLDFFVFTSSKVILFQEALQFEEAIILCYNM